LQIFAHKKLKKALFIADNIKILRQKESKEAKNDVKNKFFEFFTS